MSYWSVEDGMITAQCDEDNPAKKNQFLVWQGGEVADFELTLEFRLEGGASANSGIQIRSQIDETGHAVGYQVDIAQLESGYLGSIYDELGRKTLAAKGERTVIDRDGQFSKTSLAESADKAMASYQPGEWNQYRIVAKGATITAALNGHVTAEVEDLEEAERDLSGVLTLQLHSGPPMKVQFRHIMLQQLNPSDEKGSQ